MWRGAGIALALALLSGCDTVGAARMAYPDRALLSFDSEVQEGRFGYACTHGETEAETAARGAKAHRAFEAALESFAEVQTERLIKQLDAQAKPGTIARDLNARGEIWAAETAARIEAEYQCIPLSEV
jgi:hypothetical protein